MKRTTPHTWPSARHMQLDLFALIGLFGSQPFFAAFTSDAALIKMGVDYMSIVCIFSFGVFVEINIEKMLQATGNMIYPMIFQLIGAVVTSFWILCSSSDIWAYLPWEWPARRLRLSSARLTRDLVSDRPVHAGA